MAPDNGANVTAARQFACTVCRVLYRSDFSRCPRDGGEVVAIDPGDDPLIGSTLAGRYVIEDLIGEGGMGRVYRARHAELPRRFAIKILFGELAALSDMRARFRMEAESAARLDHTNLVPVVDVGETDEGLLYLAMEHVDGRSLATIIDDEGPLDPARAVSLARRMCRGLQHAHERGMVHRDFKPDNVLVVEKDGVEVPRIADFGLAVLTEDAGGGAGRLTRKGETMGTPPYMSPEQLTGRPVDARSDLFSLGVVLYEMLTAQTPFEGTMFEMVRQIATEAPPPMSVRAPEVAVPPELERIAQRLMATRPEDRYGSAAEVIADLDALSLRQRRARATSAPPPVDLVIDDVPAAPVVTPGRSAMSDTGELLALVKQKRRGVVAVAIVGVGLAIAGIVAVMVLRGREDSTSGEEKVALSDRPAAATPAPPPPAPVAVPDAAPQAAAPPPDAAPAAEPPPPPARKEKARADTPDRKEKPRAAQPTASADELYRDGTKLFLNGHLVEAKQKYEAALAQNSRYPAAHRGLGFVYQRLGDRAKALKHLKRYLELSPKARDAAEVQKKIESLGG